MSAKFVRATLDVAALALRKNHETELAMRLFISTEDEWVSVGWARGFSDELAFRWQYRERNKAVEAAISVLDALVVLSLVFEMFDAIREVVRANERAKGTATPHRDG